MANAASNTDLQSLALLRLLLQSLLLGACQALSNAPAPGQVPANDPITVSGEEESCSIVDVHPCPEAASTAFRQDVLDLTGSTSPHPAAHLAFQPAVQPAAHLAFQAAAQPIQQDVTDLTGSLSP